LTVSLRRNVENDRVKSVIFTVFDMTVGRVEQVVEISDIYNLDMINFYEFVDISRL
jgi:hypothetical protein